MADRLRDFTRMNPPMCTGTKTSEDPQEFIDEVHKILVVMGPLNILPTEGCCTNLVQDVARWQCSRWSASHMGAVQDNISGKILPQRDDGGQG